MYSISLSLPVLATVVVFSIIACPITHASAVPGVDVESQVVLNDGLGNEIDGPDNPHFEVVRNPSFSNYQLRVKEPKLCDSVHQYSGYLDISDTRHLFFWFLEARNSPEDAPLMLWLNGGPGCSSIASGMLFENGPCFIADEGRGTVRNNHSWNEVVNILYLDEPIGTGFSYATDGSKVDTLADLAVDVYAFLSVFLRRFPKYASTPFHLAGESWGGHYIPTIANYIFHKNKEIIYAPRKGMVKINLASVIVANGLTEPYSQFESIPDYACGGAPYPPFNTTSGPECAGLRLNRPTCLNMIKSCYRFPYRATCSPATLYCWTNMMTPAPIFSGKNPYDLRRKCDEGANVCYKEIDWAATWMNNPAIKSELGANASQTFQSCNDGVNERFYRQGQAMHNSAALLPELVNHGVRLLAYAGNTDIICNFIGIELWMSRLEHQFHTEFLQAPAFTWTTKSGYIAGKARSAGGGGQRAGNVTFVQIYDAGHMAPHDQPEATLDMITRWVTDTSFTA